MFEGPILPLTSYSGVTAQYKNKLCKIINEKIYVNQQKITNTQLHALDLEQAHNVVGLIMFVT